MNVLKLCVTEEIIIGTPEPVEQPFSIPTKPIKPQEVFCFVQAFAVVTRLSRPPTFNHQPLKAVPSHLGSAFNFV